MNPTEPVVLEFDPKFNLDKKELRDGLSAVVQIGSTLWLANDETVSLERLSDLSSEKNGSPTYGNHTRFELKDYLRLPVPPTDPANVEEADLEGLDYCDGYLWLVGSHSLKRKQPKADQSPHENLKALRKISSDGNRFLLARIPLVPEGDTYTLKQKAKLEGKRLTAAQLHGHDQGNDLTKALQSDKHLQPFLSIPGKDNGFDIEGLAVVGKRVFVGLRGPVLRGWAVILELEPKAADDTTLRLKPIGPGGCLYRKHFLQLDGLGIRDLVVDGQDLLILAGPTMVLDGPVVLFRWPGGTQPEEESVVFAEGLQTVTAVPYGLETDRGYDHPEGMTWFRSGKGDDRALLVVNDATADSRKVGDYSVRADVLPLPPIVAP